MCPYRCSLSSNKDHPGKRKNLSATEQPSVFSDRILTTSVGNWFYSLTADGTELQLYTRSQQLTTFSL